MSTSQHSETSGSRHRWRWLGVAAIIVMCVGPTFISYQPYVFEWDDSDYLRSSIEVSRAFWSWDRHGLGAMVTIRPPAMAFLGLPWGPIASWDAAAGCFITLAAVTSVLVALCLYFLLRIGAEPFYLVVASLCVFGSLGPCAPSPSKMSVAEKGLSAYFAASAFLADSLLGWTALAALLLIPYEAKTQRTSITGAFFRGILWGSILSLGVMTKISFLYFVALIVPTLLLIRRYHAGLRSALVAFAGFVCAAAPSTFYLARWGRLAFANAKASSFGGVANFYYVPLWRFVGSTIRESPGLLFSLVLMAAALAYLVSKRRTALWSPACLAFLIAVGFAMVVLAAPNRQIRYAFPAIVALPFLTAVLMSGHENPQPARFSAFVAGLVFVGLIAASVPMRHRADRQSLSRSEAILAEAAKCNAKYLVLATDSPTVSMSLMALAVDLSTEPSIKARRVSTLAYQFINGVPIQEDFHEIDEADQVIFQDSYVLEPPFTNQRVAQYEQYVRHSGYVPIRVGNDLTIYSKCRSRR